MNTLDVFLLGFITATSFAAVLFFLKFWRTTRDILFAAFAGYFLLEGVDRIGRLFYVHPNEASPWVFLVRLLALLLIVAAILQKNYGKRA